VAKQGSARSRSGEGLSAEIFTPNAESCGQRNPRTYVARTFHAVTLQRGLRELTLSLPWAPTLPLAPTLTLTVTQ
jgi:hypothetical protein